MNSTLRILTSCDFPHMFLVRFTLACAKEANAKDPMRESLPIEELIERHIAGEKGLEEALIRAYMFRPGAETPARMCTAIYAAAVVAYPNISVIYAKHTVSHSDAAGVDCLGILQDMIAKEYSELEQILMGAMG